MNNTDVTRSWTEALGAGVERGFNSFFNAFDCLTITGPTGVGKTNLALALAEVWPIEIISMDSALVYIGMDIGTAKPSAQELARVPHHLINIRTPVQVYNAAEFARDSAALIPRIRDRGRLPVIVGGTLLYYKALFEGLNAVPASDTQVRSEILAQAQVAGWPAMHAQLARVDPQTAARLPTGDAQRISRALEVWRISGRTLSSYFVDKVSPDLRNKLVSLEPEDRSWLHNRLELRFEHMLKEGLTEEVRRLRADPQLRVRLHAQLPAMRCVGYRQVWEALEEIDTSDDAKQGTDAKAGSLIQALTPQAMLRLQEKGAAATRQLAKRQLTWLRSMSQRAVIVCDKNSGQDNVRSLFELLMNSD